MGKTEERCRVDCVVVCEESLIWFESVPVVVGDEPMTAGLFLWEKFTQNPLCFMPFVFREIGRKILMYSDGA